MKDEFALQKELVGDAGVVFDVGAGIGKYAKQYVKLFPSAKVYAFEPSQNQLRILSSIEGVTPVNAAVLNIDGWTTFNMAGSKWYLNSVLGFVEGWIRGGTVAVEVPILTLDNFCEDQGIKTVDLLKIDIQGAELLALKGAQGLLSEGRIRLINSELQYQYRYKGQCWHYEVCAELARYGFYLHTLYPVYQNGRLLRANGIFVK